MAKIKLPTWAAVLSPWGWAAAAGVVVVLALAWWMITAPARRAQRDAEITAAGAFGQARAAAGADAVNTLGVAVGVAQDNERLARETADALRNAPGADQRLDPDLMRLGRERLCQRPAYRDSADCVQLLGRGKP